MLSSRGMANDKARQVAAQHEFSLRVTATPADVIAAIKAVAPKVAPGGFKGSFECVQESVRDDGLSSSWKFRPKGQVGGQPANLELHAQPSGNPGELILKLKILSFNFQKAPLPFMKPHYPGGKQLDSLRDELVSALRASPA